MGHKSIALLPPLLLLCFALIQCTLTDGGSTTGEGVISGKNKRYAKHLLHNVRQIDSDIVIDLRYATNQNVTKSRLYPSNMPCLINKWTGQKLARAQAILEQKGYGLKIWDGYRPPRSHLRLWESSPNGTYIVPPSKGWSRHTMGLAVDVTLVDALGREMRLPTGFDNFTPNASSTYKGSDPEIRHNLQILQSSMREAGFSTIPSEWWHFWDPRSLNGKVVFASQLGIMLPDHVRRVQLPGRS